MNLLDKLIDEIGIEECERIDKWIDFVNENFSGLNDWEASRQALFILNGQRINPKTLFAITNIVLRGDWFFPIRKNPLFYNISNVLEQNYSVELRYSDGIAYFTHTDQPFNFQRAIAKTCGNAD